MSGGDIKLLLPLSDGRVCHIDIFVAFRVGETFYQLGNRSGRLPDSAILPVSTITLHGVDFPAPADPEAMLAFIYGPSWRVPDPSFKYADPRAASAASTAGCAASAPTWALDRVPQRGRAATSPATAAPTSRSGSTPSCRAGAPIAELGAGTGRDALWFARRGASVIAFDFSRAARSAVEAGGPPRPAGRGAGADPQRAADRAGRRGRARARPAPPLRAAPPGLPRRPRPEQLWLLCRMALRGGGGKLFLEFSAETGDDGARRPRPEGLVRRLDPALVRREIEAAGGVVERERVRRGRDVLGNEDPDCVPDAGPLDPPGHPQPRRTQP